MISFDAFQDELEKIAVEMGMSPTKITNAGENISSAISANAQNKPALHARFDRMRSAKAEDRIGGILHKRVGRAAVLGQAGGKAFSPGGQAMIAKSKHLQGTADALGMARHQISNNFKRVLANP